MKDIVQRLQDAYADGDTSRMLDISAQAANEIERLRAALMRMEERSADGAYAERFPRVESHEGHNVVVTLADGASAVFVPSCDIAIEVAKRLRVEHLTVPCHTDHPLRHWDRTCPACIAESDQRVPCRDCGGVFCHYPSCSLLTPSSGASHRTEKT